MRRRACKQGCAPLISACLFETTYMHLNSTNVWLKPTFLVCPGEVDAEGSGRWWLLRDLDCAEGPGRCWIVLRDLDQLFL